jgi:peptidoglycan hydrolase CwlO-like protein
MRKIAILLLAAFLTTASVPVFAEDMKSSKDECLLASKNCKDDVDSIQQKIKKLQTEIKKGKKVYSAEEIKKLDAKLKEANDMLDQLNKN